MGQYLSDSNNILVFPTTKREVNDRKARLLTEQNIVGIVNRLLDVDSFVITKNFNINGSFEFNIHGYFFKIDDIGDIIELIVNSEASGGTPISSGDCIYANIHTFVTGDYEELYGIDENGSYDGVVFTINEPLQNTNKFLKILEYSSSYGWSVPDSSYAKFDGNSLIDPLDCGEL